VDIPFARFGHPTAGETAVKKRPAPVLSRRVGSGQKRRMPAMGTTAWPRPTPRSTFSAPSSRCRS